MGENSAISWCDHTYNHWIGCTKISPACDHCYAERDNARRKWTEGWGHGVPRRRTKTHRDPLKWNALAAQTGQRPRVFCSSLSDVFDNEVPDDWRNDLWSLIYDTPNLRWILLTKRIGNAPKMIPWAWQNGHWPQHVGLMSTIVNQQEWDRDYLKLKAWRAYAPWIGVSVEPILGFINIRDERPDWIITGGESGPDRRPLDFEAVRSLRDQCASNGIAFHHKQNGGLRGKDGGCLIDGREHKAFPPALAA